MAAKKVVYVIVEGPTDEDALGVIFRRYFDRNTVRVKVIHGDITTESRTNPSNILSRIKDIVQQSLKEYRLRKTDLLRIIHLVDTDGSYIPDSAVLFNESAAKAVYSETAIMTANPEGIILRNHQKRANLTKLYSTEYVWGNIPYSVFYMSCNLDHALYGKLNLTDKEKESEALRFAERYMDDIPSFITFIRESVFSSVAGYMYSWEYIKKDLHSLERNTNLGLCFDATDMKAEP